MTTRIIRGKRYTHYTKHGLSFGKATAEHYVYNLRSRGYQAVMARLGREWAVYYIPRKRR